MPELIPGVAFALSPLVRRILAPDASPETGPGTNTYLVGIDEVAVIDPGPDIRGHLDAIAGCGGDRIRWILLTHAHGGHAASAAILKQRTGAEILAFGAKGPVAVDRKIKDGESLQGTEWRLKVLHTPGHAPDHLCFLLAEERMLFSGDHLIAGQNTSTGRGGDPDAWAEQLRRLEGLRLRTIAPGHGELIEDAASAVKAALARAAQGS